MSIESEMQKLKALGITINVTTGNGEAPTGVSALMKNAAQQAGIYYEREESE